MEDACGGSSQTIRWWESCFSYGGGRQTLRWVWAMWMFVMYVCVCACLCGLTSTHRVFHLNRYSLSSSTSRPSTVPTNVTKYASSTLSDHSTTICPATFPAGSATHPATISAAYPAGSATHPATISAACPASSTACPVHSAACTTYSIGSVPARAEPTRTGNKWVFTTPHTNAVIISLHRL